MNSVSSPRFAPAYGRDRRVDLNIAEGEVELRFSKWVNGLGWCGEKTIQMDETLLEDLYKLIAAARIRVREEQEDRSISHNPRSAVLDFPNCGSRT